jgi:uncharacterized protein (TIGR02453 family)
MARSTYFSTDLFEFLRQLKRRNDREWFAKNKERYQQVVVDPALRFIADFAEPLATLSPHFVADARPTRGSLFRIYRDTRFSADKKPYKTHIGIHFSHVNGKDAHAPVFYLHLQPEGSFAAAGIWHPDNRALTKIRSAIVANPKRWKQATRNLELEGERLVRPPKGFSSSDPCIEDLKLKDFIASTAFTDKQICHANFLQEFTSACQTMQPLVAFTTQSLGLKF